MKREEAQAAIESATFAEHHHGEMRGISKAELDNLITLARLGLRVKWPSEEETAALAYVIFRQGFHVDDWGDGLTSVVNIKWSEWDDDRERCKRLAKSALSALTEQQ